MKKLLGIVFVLLSVQASAYLLTDRSTFENVCYEISDDEMGGAVCTMTSSTTSFPTMAIEGQDQSINSVEVLTKVIEERKLSSEEATSTQSVADYFSVEVQDVQAVVEDLYTGNRDITLESIKSELGL